MSKVYAYSLIALLSLSILVIALSNAQTVYAATAWSAKKNLSINAGFSDNPQIAVSGSNVYVAWGDDTPGNSEILFRASSDDGATWSAKKNLSNNAGQSTLQQIAVSGSNVYVAWQDGTPGNYDILFRAGTTT